MLFFAFSTVGRRNRFGIAGVALSLHLGLFCLCITTSHADSFRAQIQTRQEANAVALYINGQAALRIREGLGGLTSAERAQVIAERLGALCGPQKITVVAMNRQELAIETANDRLLLLVTNADAMAQMSALGPLARRWAAAIQTLLSLPPISLAQGTPLIIPTGQTRSIKVGGAAPAQMLSVQDGAPSVAVSRLDMGSRSVVVQGLAAGSEQVRIVASDGQGAECEKILHVVVEDLAATIGSQAGARVTGAPSAPRALVIQAVYNALYRIIQVPHGAHIDLLESPDITKDLPQGQSVSVAVSVRATGFGLFPVFARPLITISNDSSLPTLFAADLFYSNDPEEVKHPQTLFSATLPARSRPARLVYHHVNSSGAPILIRIQVINRGASDATLHLVQGRGGPADDPVQAGYKAGEQFLQGLQGNDGLVLALPARSQLTLMSDRLPIGQTFSGYIQLAQIGPVQSDMVLTVDAEPVDSEPPDPLSPLVCPINGGGGAYPLTTVANDSAANPHEVTISENIYDTPAVALSGCYNVGARWLYINLGTDLAIARKTGGDPLWGNYGVLYTCKITLKNASAIERAVVVEFQPQAGLAAGLFLIDNNEWVSIGPTQAPEERPIARLELAPGQSTTLEIKTMPLSGSAYPVALIAHAL